MSERTRPPELAAIDRLILKPALITALTATVSALLALAGDRDFATWMLAATVTGWFAILVNSLVRVRVRSHMLSVRGRQPDE